jgi:hypothetical protein
MRRRVIAGVTVLIAGACGNGGTGNASGQVGGSAVARANVPPFPADSAYELVRKQVGFGPRVPGTPAHAEQLQWMIDYLRPLVDTLEVMPFDHESRDGGGTVRMTNLLARFHPERSDRILLVTHWDTRPMADSESDDAKRNQPIPGATDGGSGTAVLLQLATVLSGHSAPIGVDLLFVDGEDFGPGEMFLGASHFAAGAAAYKPLYGILVDMVGDRSPVYPIESNTKDFAPEVIERVWRVAEELGYGNAFVRRTGIAIDDDHVVLNRAGIRTIDIIDFDYGPGNSYWHTLQDDLSNTSPAGLGMVGSVLAALIYRGG